jgi:hypothetical protein
VAGEFNGLEPRHAVWGLPTTAAIRITCADPSQESQSGDVPTASLSGRFAGVAMHELPPPIRRGDIRYLYQHGSPFLPSTARVLPHRVDILTIGQRRSDYFDRPGLWTDLRSKWNGNYCRFVQEFGCVHHG